MKTIFLFRHAKSDWDAGSGNDHDRPLAKRGQKAACVMGRFLAEIEQVPEQVFTSSARRALDTVTLAAEAGEWRCPIEVVSDLYDTHAAAVIDFVRKLDDAAESILLTGHQPTWSSLVACLTGGSQVRFPTAAIARIDLEVSRWRQVSEGAGELVWLMPPRPLTKVR